MKKITGIRRIDRIGNLHDLLEDRETLPQRLMAKSRLMTEKPFPDLNTVLSPFTDAGVMQESVRTILQINRTDGSFKPWLLPVQCQI